ncbi:MAG: acyl carrier protein, partial [Nostoc sp.]
MNELDLHLRHDLILSKDQMAIAPEGVAVDSLIARVLGINVERISNDLMYQSIREWDSLSHVTLMIALETELGTKITDQIMLQLHSVSAIREFAQFSPLRGQGSHCTRGTWLKCFSVCGSCYDRMQGKPLCSNHRSHCSLLRIFAWWCNRASS